MVVEEGELSVGRNRYVVLGAEGLLLPVVVEEVEGSCAGPWGLREEDLA